MQLELIKYVHSKENNILVWKVPDTGLFKLMGFKHRMHKAIGHGDIWYSLEGRKLLPDEVCEELYRLESEELLKEYQNKLNERSKLN